MPGADNVPAGNNAEVVKVGVVPRTTDPVPVLAVTPVPPLATGSVPVTSVVRPTCAKLTIVPSVRRTRLAVVPEVNEGAPEALVTSAEVLADVRPPTVFVELEYKS